MNDYEKSEFERHKKAAEKQLNEMYYGTGNKSRNNNGIAMPSFISVPKNGQNKGQSQKSENTQNDKEKNETKTLESKTSKVQEPSPKKSQNSPILGKNILNMLNFKGIKMDNDRLIILAVCLLLAGEETDELLMLALIYIML